MVKEIYGPFIIELDLLPFFQDLRGNLNVLNVQNGSKTKMAEGNMKKATKLFLESSVIDVKNRLNIQKVWQNT